MAGGHGEADGHARRGPLGAVVDRRALHDEHEDEAEQDLGEEGLADADAGPRPRDADGHVVGLAEQDVGGEHAEHGADELGDDVGGGAEEREAAAQRLPEGHGRVQVGAGDVAQRVGHGEEGQAEAQADGDLLGRVGGAAEREHRAHAEEEEHEGAEELGEGGAGQRGVHGAVLAAAGAGGGARGAVRSRGHRASVPAAGRACTLPQATRSSSATHSMCGVCGNMSTGRTRRSA